MKIDMIFILFIWCTIGCSEHASKGHFVKIKEVTVNTYTAAKIKEKGNCQDLMKSDSLNINYPIFFDFLFTTDFVNVNGRYDSGKDEGIDGAFEKIDSFEVVLLRDEKTKYSFVNELRADTSLRKIQINEKRHINYILKLDCEKINARYTGISDFIQKHNSIELKYDFIELPGLILTMYPKNFETGKYKFRCKIKFQSYYVEYERGLILYK